MPRPLPQKIATGPGQGAGRPGPPGPPGSEFSAGLDLAGTSSEQSVIGFRDRPLSTAVPSSGDSYVFNGTEWVPQPAGGGGGGFTAGGDLSGSPTSQEVVGIAGFPISAGPTTGVVYQFNGTQWVPTVPATGCAKSGTTTTGSFACAENHNTTATGNFSHAEGDGGESRGQASHAEGTGCLAVGVSSHVEGQGTRADLANGHAEGLSTLAGGAQSHAEGNGCHADGESSHAEGFNSGAGGQSSHCEGRGSSSSGLGSHAEGIITIASGTGSHSEGSFTAAQGDTSHAEGNATTASGVDSHAEGNNTTAMGAHSHAAGALSVAYGNSEYAHSGGPFSVAGDNQYRRTQLRGSTPGSVAGENTVLTQGTGAQPIAIRNSTCYGVTVRATASVMGLGAAARQAAYYHIEFLASVTSAGVVTVSSPAVVVTPILQGAGFVGATLVASSSGANVLTLTFTLDPGVTAATRITATIEFVEVLGT